jgi:hypothetical protein
LNPAVSNPASDRTSASVEPELTPIEPSPSKTLRDASIDGKEKGVQFPVA